MIMDRMSNMLSNIKNHSMAGRTVLEIPYTKECEAVAKVLKERGFLEGMKIFKEVKSSAQGGKKMMRLDLIVADGTPKITVIKRISKPGRRVYMGSAKLKKVAGGFGVLVVSTSRGVMSGDEAKKKKLGGEVICSVL